MTCIFSDKLVQDVGQQLAIKVECSFHINFQEFILENAFSGPSNQSSSQGKLSVGKVVGQLRMASQEMKGVVANKGISAISTRVGGSGSMVAARRLVFEPEKKLPEESMGLVKKAVKSMEEGARVMENDLESRGKVAKPVARKVVVAFRKKGEGFPLFAVELTIL